MVKYLAKRDQIVCKMIIASLWGKDVDESIDHEIYAEMEKHAILSLATPILSSLHMTSDIEKAWKAKILQQVSYNVQYRYIQDALPITVPYVIIKGTSAAQYYPYPEYRTMGDIDIVTRQEDFEQAYQQLQSNGYHYINDNKREIVLKKNGVIVELHRCFASLNDPAYAKYLDDLIFENITTTHILPDMINGLVLLEHISQHLEHGLGLRQIIDWMMYVSKCLPEEKWPSFQKFTSRIGLEKLALVTTRMCELYFGLPQRKWCAKVDETLCEQLMDYVFSCGNFGIKRVSETDISEDVFAYATNLRMTFRLLQKQGLFNWKAAKKHRVLRPFAWIYQACRYASRGLKRDQAFSKVHSEYLAAHKRNAMLNELGVKMSAKGIYYLQGDKYVKK